MRTYLLSFLFILFSFSFAQTNEEVNQIKEHLKKSEEATTKTSRGDKAIFHAVLAEQLFHEYNINDIELEQEIQLKFIGAFRLTNQPENARKHLKHLLTLYVKSGHFASRNYLLNAGRLASDYMNAGQLDSALRYFQLANESANLELNNIYIASTLNNLGILYEKRNQWEKAILYYNKAAALLIQRTEKDSTFLTSVNDNKANYYFQKGENKIGTQLLQENIQYLKKKPKEYKKLTQYCFRLIDIYVSKSKWAGVKELLSYIKSCLSKGKPDWKLNQTIKYHEVMITYLKQVGSNKALLNEYRLLDSLKSVALLKIEQQRVLINNSMSDYFLLSADQELAREKERAVQAEEKNNRRTFFVVAFLIIVVIISILLRSSAKRKLRAETAERKMKEQALQLKELENLSLSEDLQHKSNDFSTLMMQTSLKEDWSLDLIHQLEDLYKNHESIAPAELKKIVRNLKQKSGVYDKVNLQQKGMEEANSAFFDRLNKQHPKLTKAERELCGLIRLRLDGKEIAVIRNIHPSSVRKLRHRLRKKLELPVEEDIYKFIAKI